jgi:predicted small lipoprotein YifL
MTIEIRRPLVLLTMLLLAGCGALKPAPDVTRVPDNPETAKQAEARRSHAARPTYNLAGYPPAVREGYIDGCESAKRTRFARKDAQRMSDDAQYSMGWNDGFSICGK